METFTSTMESKWNGRKLGRWSETTSSDQQPSESNYIGVVMSWSVIIISNATGIPFQALCTANRVRTAMRDSAFGIISNASIKILNVWTRFWLAPWILHSYFLRTFTYAALRSIWQGKQTGFTVELELVQLEFVKWGDSQNNGELRRWCNKFMTTKKKRIPGIKIQVRTLAFFYCLILSLTCQKVITIKASITEESTWVSSS